MDYWFPRAAMTTQAIASTRAWAVFPPLRRISPLTVCYATAAKKVFSCYEKPPAPFFDIRAGGFLVQWQSDCISLDQVLNVKSRVHIVNVLLIQFLSQQLNSLAKPLEVNDLTLTQEFDHVVDIRVITEPEDVIVGRARLLLWYIDLFAKVFYRLFENKRYHVTNYDVFLSWHFFC